MNMGIMDAIVLAKSIASGDLERYAKQRHADASDWVRLNRRISTIALDSTVTTTQTLVSGQSILVDGSGTNTGSIIVGRKTAISVTYDTSAGAITNSGTISGGGYGIYASGSTLEGGINNSGTINGGSVGINAYVSTLKGGITNSGTIRGGSVGIYANTDATLTGGINNLGSISGATAGLAAYQSTLTDGITNSGTIRGGIHAVGSTRTGGITNSGMISGENGIAALGASTLEGGITNSGSISGGRNGAGIYAQSFSTLKGGITNSGLISSTGLQGIVLTSTSILTNGITNSGTISGESTGIRAYQSTLTGGITNSGTIRGGAYAVSVVSHWPWPSTLTGGILVTGTSAQFIGDIYAPNVDLTLASGAAFTNSNAMSLSGVIVSSGATFNLANAASASSNILGNINVGNGTGYFTNQGTVDVGSRGASATPTITGNYTQDAGGTFKTTVVSDIEYGQMRVTGSATLAGTAEVTASGVSHWVGSTLAG